MRNLKRALSLTLASVMLLGMMVVGSSAAAGYDDVADTDNVEAIEVLQAVEVMVGDERGFGPERPVNRAEMAVVMGKLLNLDYNYYEATCPFNDVYDWARGWVGACYANGIVSGRGEGVYDPGTTVTAVEAASMLMRALGYFKYQSDYASGFEVSTVLQANKIRLFDGVNSKTNEPLTRNQVAQMALNALKSGMVEPDGNALNFIDASGNVIATGGKVNYVYVTSNKAFATAISKTQASSMGSTNDAPIVELGEQLYNGKLKLDDSALDDFGRPSRHWEFDAKNIGTYVKKELIKQEYTVKVTGKTLYELLGSATIKDYDLDVYVDGVSDSDILDDAYFDARHLVRTYDKAVGKTGNGVLTQVFVDPDEGANGLITIAIINTYLTKAIEDYDDRTDDVDVRVYGIDEVRSTKQGVTYTEYVKAADIDTYADNKAPYDQHEDFKLELEDFPEAADVKDGDFFLVNVANGKIQALGKPEILSNTKISSFKLADWIVSGGTQYDFASAAEYEYETLSIYTLKNSAITNLKDINYNIYLDQYGYAIGVEEVDREDNYMFITGVDTNTNNRYNVQADANAIFLDGTMESIKIDMKAVDDLDDKHATLNALTNGERGGSLVNKWFTYSVGDDGVYDVALVDIDVEKFENGTRAGQFWTLTKNDTADETDSKLITGSTIVVGRGGSNGIDKVDGPQDIVLRGAKAYGTPYYSVYGDDKSVFITAELNRINDAEDKPVNVIGGVDNVAVGVDNASIDVWGKSEAITKEGNGTNALATAYGSYVLYDDDGNIIGAVVVGEDSGSVTNLVYTHKERIESETDNNASDSKAAVKGTYTWTRKVVSDGEEVLLTEVGTGMSKLKNMKAYTWYVVKYNAKGEVKNVYPAWDTVGYGYKGLIDAPVLNDDGTLTDTVKNQDIRLKDRYVNWIEELYQATDENRTVLYEVGGYNDGDTNEWIHEAVGHQEYWYGDKPTVANHTFYMNTRTGESKNQGFRVADDVKTVFIQTNNRDTTTTFEDGYSRLEKVVDRLHDRAEYNRDKWVGTGNLNDGPDVCHYEVSALMENGKAVVVVIRDLNDAGAVISDKTGNQELRLYGNLYTSPTTVTSASNTSVVVGNEEIKPNGVGRDKYKGNYTSYTIPVNSMVSINDRDIQEDTFDYLTNLTRADDNLVVRKYLQTITFTMPNTVAEIAGSNVKITSEVEVEVGKAELKDLDAMFIDPDTGNKVDSLRNKSVGDEVKIVIGTDLRTRTISAIEPDTSYIVNLGTPGTNYTASSDSSKTITVEKYKLTTMDIWMGVVVINDITADGSTPPVGEEQTKLIYTYNDEEVTVTGNVSPVKRGTPVELTVTAKTGYKDVVVKADGVAVELKDGKYVIETTGKESVKVEITVTKDDGNDDPDAITVTLNTETPVTLTAGEAVTLKGTGITAGAWYYVSVIGGAEFRGAQKAAADGTLSFTAPATGEREVYVSAATPIVAPTATAPGFMMFRDEVDGNITDTLSLIAPAGAQAAGGAVSMLFSRFASMARAAVSQLIEIKIGVDEQGNDIIVCFSKNPNGRGYLLFTSDAQKIVNAPKDENGIVGAVLTTTTIQEDADNLTAFEAAIDEVNGDEIKEISFEIGAPKAPNVELVSSIVSADGKLKADIKWYEVDEDGTVSEVPTTDTVANANKTYVSKVVVTPTEESRLVMAETVTVNGTEVENVGEFGVSIDENGEAEAATEPENPNVTAKVEETNDGDSVTFTEYVPGATSEVVDELTAAEIAGALARKFPGETFTVNEDKTQAVSDKRTLDVDPNPTQVWKVTYPGNSEGVEIAKGDSADLKNVTRGVQYLLPEDSVIGTGASVDPTTRTATNYTLSVKKDINLVAAVALDATNQIANGQVKENKNSGSIISLIAEIKVDGVNWVPLAYNGVSATHIQEGTQIRFTKPATPGFDYKNGGTVTLNVNENEKVLTFSVATDGTYTPDVDYYDVPVATTTNEGKLVLEANFDAVSDDTVYTLDGETIEPQTMPDGETKYLHIEGLETDNIYLVWLNESDPENPVYTPVDDVTPDQGGEANPYLTTITATATAPKDGEIKLFHAYKVKPEGTVWNAYKENPANMTDAEKTEVEVDTSEGEYFPIDAENPTTLWVEGQAKTFLCEKDATEALSDEVRLPNAGSGTGIWSIELSKSLAATDIEVLFSIGAATWQLDIPGEVAKTNTTGIDITNALAYGTGVEGTRLANVIKGLDIQVTKFEGASLLADAKLSFTAKVNTETATTLTVTPKATGTSDWKTAAEDADGEDIGTSGSLYITINGVRVIISLGVDERELNNAEILDAAEAAVRAALPKEIAKTDENAADLDNLKTAFKSDPLADTVLTGTGVEYGTEKVTWDEASKPATHATSGETAGAGEDGLLKGTVNLVITATVGDTPVTGTVDFEIPIKHKTWNDVCQDALEEAKAALTTLGSVTAEAKTTAAVTTAIGTAVDELDTDDLDYTAGEVTYTDGDSSATVTVTISHKTNASGTTAVQVTGVTADITTG